MKNIMIIDDNKEILELTRQILELNDYSVFTFDYFKVALKFYRLRYKDISLILLDMQLIDATHIDSIPSLHDINPDVRIIGMSGGLGRSDLELEYQKQLKSFLQKPFRIEELLSKICLCAA